jgi:hypothetical protein
MFWLNAAAFAGLALVALPIAIHLLVRQHTRTLAFPSLRFVSETALAAFRWRAIQDPLLLLCRVAVLVAAVAALAGPVLQTPARTASYADRIARAYVRVDGNETGAGAAGLTDAYRFASFARADVADAIGEARRWLDLQPPAAREIVFGGALARGALDDGHLAGIPAAVGIRFFRTETPSRPTEISVPTLVLRDGVMTRVDQRVDADADATRLTGSTMADAPSDSVRVIAAEKDQPLAEAALRAALTAGVRWTTRRRNVLIVWEGAAAAPPSPDIETIHMPVPAEKTAASAIWTALSRSADPLAEPVLIPEEQLKAWTRVPGPPPPQSVPSDEGDRRWLWMTALALLGFEAWLRRRGADRGAAGQEARVA